MSKWNQTMGGGDIVYTSPEDIISRGKIVKGRPSKVTMSSFNEGTQQYSPEWTEKKATIRKMKYGGYTAVIEGEEGAYRLDGELRTRKGGPWDHRMSFPYTHKDLR